MGYGIFHCDSMKHKVILHSITMKYAVSHMKMPHVYWSPLIGDNKPEQKYECPASNS